MITQVIHDKIVRCLTNQCSSDCNARFISWCRASFAVQKNETKILLCDAKSKKPVLLYESMYDVYKHTHIETAHAGRDKCLDSLSVNYSRYNGTLKKINEVCRTHLKGSVEFFILFLRLWTHLEPSRNLQNLFRWVLKTSFRVGF